MDEPEAVSESQETAESAVPVAESASEASAEEQATEQPSLDLVIDLPLEVSVEVGSARMLMREVLELGNGSVVELDRGVNDPVDVLVNGRLVARGDLTSVDERLAVRIVELVRATPRGSGTDS